MAERAIIQPCEAKQRTGLDCCPEWVIEGLERRMNAEFLAGNTAQAEEYFKQVMRLVKLFEDCEES